MALANQAQVEVGIVSRKFYGQRVKVNRFSCKCKLCKSAWTTEDANYLAVMLKHESECQAFQDKLNQRRQSRFSQSLEGERYQMYALGYFSHRQIIGTYNPNVKCNGICIHAKGHSCDCSCGGANHGTGSSR